MSAGTYIDGDTMHLPDVHGFDATVPVRVVHVLRETARNNDTGEAQWGLTWLTRDALIGAADLIDTRDPCTTTPCDNAAVFDLADPRPRCDQHHKES